MAPALLESQRAAPFRLPGRTAALLVGTDSYNAAREWTRLSSPVFDATTLARTLASDFGYDTTVVRNASKDEIIRAIITHGKQAAAEDDWVLVFIASHGYFDDDRGQGYLVFRDSRARNDDVSRSSYLSLSELRGIIEGYRAGHVLLVIDACYGGTIDPDIRTGIDRGATRGDVESALQRRSQYRSRQYLTSGGKEYVPDGRPGAHSPFAAALLGVLRQASVEARPLTFAQVVASMADQAVEPLPRHNSFRGHQPGGDFILVPRSFATTTGTPLPARTREPSPVRGDEPVRERPAASDASRTYVQLAVQVDAVARQAGSGYDIEAIVRSTIHNAFTSRGIDGVLESATASCPASPAGARCVQVRARVNIQVTGGRQTAIITLTASDGGRGVQLASETGQAGPYDRTVPLLRIVERATTARLDVFVEATLAARR